MTEMLLCLNSEWQGCDNPILESGSRHLAEELFGAHQYLDFGPSDSGRPSTRDGVFALDHVVARFVTVLETLRREGPERVFTVGGTCGAEAAPIAYLNERNRGRLGVVWFDAHGDMHTPESSLSSHFHGMVLRTLLGEGPDELLDQMHERVDPSRLVLAGVRDLDEAELQYVDSTRIRVLRGWPATAAQSIIDALSDADVGGLYVHIDVDLFNPGSFDDTLFSVSGGPTLPQVADAIAALGDAFDVVGIGVVEYCGRRDGSASRLSEFLRKAGLWPSLTAAAWKE
jgi:arginase